MEKQTIVKARIRCGAPGSVLPPHTSGQPRKGLSGQSLVEFALISVALITVIVGVFEFGLMFWRNSTVDYASREGARALSVASASATADQQMIFAISVALQPVGIDRVIGIRVQKLKPNTVANNAATDPSGDSDYTADANHVNYLNNLRCDTNTSHKTYFLPNKLASQAIRCDITDPSDPNFNPNYIADYHHVDCAPPGYNPANASPCASDASQPSWKFRGIDANDPVQVQDINDMQFVLWPPRNVVSTTSRRNCIPTDVFRVDITIRHSWITGLIPGGPMALTDGTRMRIEPTFYSTSTNTC